MSWNFRKIGQNRAALIAAVQAEHAPDAIKAEVCARINEIPLATDKLAIYVESNGHLAGNDERPWQHVDSIVIRVWTIPFINTPEKDAIELGAAARAAGPEVEY